MAGAGMVSRTMLGEVCDGTNRVKCTSLPSLQLRQPSMRRRPPDGQDGTGEKCFGIVMRNGADQAGFSIFSPALIVGTTIGYVYPC